ALRPLKSLGSLTVHARCALTRPTLSRRLHGPKNLLNSNTILKLMKNGHNLVMATILPLGLVFLPLNSNSQEAPAGDVPGNPWTWQGGATGRVGQIMSREGASSHSAANRGCRGSHARLSEKDRRADAPQ